MIKIAFIFIFFSLCGTINVCAQDTILKKEYIRKGDLVYYKDSLYTGIAIKKADNGKIVAVEKFKNGLADGIWKEWYKTGEIKFQGAFVKGINDGIWTEWNLDGTVQRRIAFKGGNTVEIKHPGIMEKVENTNLVSSFDTVELVNDEFMSGTSDGGVSLTGCYKNGKIWKMTRWVGISMGNEIYNYYFEDEKLIYINETFESFVWNDSTGIMDLTKTEITFQGNYYFSNNKLIDLETTGHNRFEDDALDIEKTLIDESNGNLQLLKRKKK